MADYLVGVSVCESSVISWSISYLEYSQPLRRRGFGVGAVLYDRVGLGADAEDEIDRTFFGGGEERVGQLGNL